MKTRDLISGCLCWAMVLGVAGCSTNGTAVEPKVPDAESGTDAGPASSGDGDYTVKLETSKGDVLIEVHRDWAPIGADHFRELVEAGFYDGCRFFRVLDGFMAQVGINGDPETHAKWSKNIKDDPVVASNTRGFVTYAKTGAPNSRSTQIFINYGDNSQLDPQGFAPFGKVVKGMDVVEKLYSGYGEGAPQGRGPSQQRITYEGNAYLEKQFPKLDYIKKATVVQDEGEDESDESGAQ